MQFIAKAYPSLSPWSWPSLCRICAQWNSGPVCPACCSQHLRHQTRCGRCALPSLHTLCADCQGAPPPWQFCATALPYEEPWRSLIADYKFHGQVGLADFWGKCLRQRVAELNMLAAAELVVPVPLSRERLRERGYNQSLLLARALKHPGLVPDGLLRLRHTPAQASLPRHERLRNLTHAIVCNPRQMQGFHQRHVLLVDDVMTTGSTLLACTHALLTAGVQRVDLLVLARADPHQAPQSGPDH